MTAKSCILSDMAKNINRFPIHSGFPTDQNSILITYINDVEVSARINVDLQNDLIFSKPVKHRWMSIEPFTMRVKISHDAWFPGLFEYDFVIVFDNTTCDYYALFIDELEYMEAILEHPSLFVNGKVTYHVC